MTDGHTQRLESALAGRYRVQKRLGEGGMATVYLAEDIKHERKVALKILKPELAAVIGAERFLSEIKTTANLQHPHILALFDSGEADGFLYELAFVAPQGDLAVYSSNATGQWEVYVRNFPVPGTPEKISEGGGDFPQWSADGNSIYYTNAVEDSLMVARIDRGPPFAVLGSRAVMAWPYGNRFHLHPDGNRFITTQVVEQSGSTGDQEVAPPTRYFVVTNWFDELRRRSGEGGR